MSFAETRILENLKTKNSNMDYISKFSICILVLTLSLETYLKKSKKKVVWKYANIGGIPKSDNACFSGKFFVPLPQDIIPLIVMTVLDKKQYLNQIVAHLSEEHIDQMLAYANTLAIPQNEKHEAKFEELLALTNEKYKKVWEALA